MNQLKKLQQFLQRQKYDGILIRHPQNLRYFAGFTGTTALALITADSAVIFTDGRYTTQAERECTSYRVVEYAGSLFDTVKSYIKNNCRTLAFEGTHTSYDVFVLMREAFPSCNWESIALEPLRAIKTEEEIAFLKKAAQIADRAFAAMLTQVSRGMTENELRTVLEVEMLRAGSTERSFETIVASGWRSSLPHGVATNKVIAEGDFVTIDFGAIYAGYHSDMTRTIVFGTPSAKQQEIYHLVLDSQTKGVAAVKAGVTGKFVDEVSRNIIKQAGYGSYFSHGLGHGVGLDIHELPVLSPRSTDILKENMLVTVEPGIYIPNEMGVRIEDSLFVTETGSDVITLTTKKLIEIR